MPTKETTATGYAVVMSLEDFGEETFGPYHTLKEAHEALARVAGKAAGLNDGVRRSFEVQIQIAEGV